MIGALRRAAVGVVHSEETFDARLRCCFHSGRAASHYRSPNIFGRSAVVPRARGVR
jgi:hypothetical protein